MRDQFPIILDKRRNYTWIAYLIVCVLMVPFVGVFIFYRIR